MAAETEHDGTGDGGLFGSIRSVRRFAFVPARLWSGQWVCWQWVTEKQRLEPDYSGWTTGKWVTVHRALASTTH